MRCELFSVREGKDEEVAFAGDDDGEGVAVSGDGEFAEGEAVKNWNRRGLRHWDFFVGSVGCERRSGKPDDVAGFFFNRAFEEDARAVGSPSRDAEADSNARELIGMRKAADFQNFAINEVRGFGAVGRNDEAAFVAVERGEFLVRIVEYVHISQPGWAAHGMVLLDGDGEIHSGEPGDVAKRAALVRRRERAAGEARGFDGIEWKRANGVD